VTRPLFRGGHDRIDGVVACLAQEGHVPRLASVRVARALTPLRRGFDPGDLGAHTALTGSL
jgi:hypothetical protein